MRAVGVGGRAAELIVMFEEAVLAVHHLREAESFTVGEEVGATLPFAGVESELVRFERDHVVLIEDPGFTWALLDEVGTSTTIDWLRDPVSKRSVCVLPASRRAQLTRGALSILVADGPAPRKASLPPPIDLRVHMSSAAVGLLCSLALFAITALPPGSSMLTVDAFALSNRLANMTIVPAVVHAELGAGQSGGGAELSSPTPAAKAPGHARSARPTPPSRNRSSSKEDAVAAVAASGLIGTLRAMDHAQVGSIFGPGSSLSADAQAAFDSTEQGLGDDGGNGPGGPGGAGLVAGGSHGPGEGTVGLGKIGSGSCGGCGGSDRYGKHVGLGPHIATAPTLELKGDVSTVGTMDKEIIRRVIRRHMNELRFCYDKALQRNGALDGRIVTSFIIAADGRVLTSKIVSSTMNAPDVEACVVDTYRRFEFPKAMNGGSTMVSYPLQFHASSGT